MTDIPDETVVRRVEDVVERDRELDDAEARAEMAARHRNRIDGFAAQFVGESRQLTFRELTQIAR